MGPKSGSNTKSDGFGFHHTQWETSGEDDDKGRRTSSDWSASDGGWVKDSEHNTDQNVERGEPGRHPD